MKKVFVVYATDNVGTAVLEPIQTGDHVGCNGDLQRPRGHRAGPDIAYGHKIALMDIAEGDTVLKYGLSIGPASCDIKEGEHVHAHNVESNRGRGDLADRNAVTAE